MEREVKTVPRALLGCILAATAVVYLGTLQFGFVSDDVLLLLNNPVLRSWRSVPYYFTHNLWAHQYEWTAYYRPIHMLLFRVEYRLFGASTPVWHAVNILLHLIATGLVYLLARRLLTGTWKPLFAAAIFGLHPVHVEVVSWIAANGDSLLAIFVLASLICYLRGRAGEGSPLFWNSSAVFFYALAVLTKEPGIFIPAFIVAYELWMARREGTARPSLLSRAAALIRRMLPWAAVAALYICVRLSVLGAFSHDAMPFPKSVVVKTWPWLLWFYSKHLLWPDESSLYFNNPYVFAADWPSFWMPLSALLILSTILFLWWWRTRNGLIPFALVCFLLPLSTTFNINLFQIHDFAHDRFLYVPSIFICLLAAEAFGGLLSRGREVMPGLPLARASAFAVLMIVFAVQCVRISLPWASELLLYTHGIKVSGDHSALAHSNLGWMYFRAEKYANAAVEWQESARQYPNWWQMHENIGNVYMKLERFADAEQEFATAARITAPENAAMLFRVGTARMSMARWQDAETVLMEAAAKVRGRAESANYEATLAACRAQMRAAEPMKAKP